MTYPFKSQMTQKTAFQLTIVNHLTLKYHFMVMGLSAWKSASAPSLVNHINHFYINKYRSIRYRKTQTILRKVVNNEQVINNYHKTRHLRAFSLIKVVNYG